METRYLTLLEFCTQMRYVVDHAGLEGWVCAEVAQMSVNYKGHCYLELIQKAENSDAPVAKLRATIWASTAAAILPPFEQATGSRLTDGMKVLVYVSMSYSEIYGLSANIRAIDPNFTMGELEARRKAIIAQLEKDGVIDMNKQLRLPTVLKRIAVISAKTAAGYGDFCNQLASNQYGISISTTLFAAVVQGVEAEKSIISALDAVAVRASEFDAVAIIRGGGSKMDLACFDSYDVALNIAQFPLPVITGIGHERDRSIADFVAHTSVKTPTAVAEFIIQHDADFLALLDGYSRRLQLASSATLASAKARIEQLRLTLSGGVTRRMDEGRHVLANLELRAQNAVFSQLATQKNRVEGLENRVVWQMTSLVRNENTRLDTLRSRLTSAAMMKISTETMRLENLKISLEAKDPRKILAKGFTLTTHADGTQIKEAASVKTGETIVTHFADGSVKSRVEKE